ncbi:MAG: tol-pal system protein YbgF [Pseudomonadales bacterium]|nr:tol-pal system protein YbgF [Pseudomonadales bacterium]
MGPLFASLFALTLLALSCDVRASQAGAPVEERPLPPLLTPPGAIREPGPGEAAAPDPLVSDVAAPEAGTAAFRQPTFVTPSRGSAAPIQRGEVEADAAGTLFAELQDLQQEVMALRGLLEAQQNRIDLLEREQRDRYLDLDRRLSLLGRGGLAAQPADRAGVEGAGAAAGADGAEPADERGAYERAFALTREKRFEEAIPAFRRVIDDYPGGQYVPNAWYWLGELYLALPEPNLELARQSFVQVIQLWPEDRKAPDAKYKLGVVHDRLGEPEQARNYLQAVIREHGGSPAARLAASYLDRIEG